MSTLTLATGRPTLADYVFARGIAADLVLVAAGTALTAIAAQLVIPMWPIPITGQTFAVLLVGTVLGPIRGALSMVFYLALGSVGLPIFASGGAGNLIGTTSGGFVLGFIGAAALVGWLAQREWDHRGLKTAVSFVAGTAVMYAVGLPWLYAVLGTLSPTDLAGSFGRTDLVQATLTGGLYPFIIGDLVKAVIAAGILPLTWKLVSRADTEAMDGSEH